MKAIILSLLSLCALGISKGQSTTEVRFVCTEVQSKKGNWMIALYQDEKSFLSHQPFRAKIRSVSEGKTIDFKLPKGEYAVALFQDLNGNFELDKDDQGIPNEPYSFSGEGLFPLQGKPSFQEAKFQVEDQHLEIRLPLQYHNDK